MNGSSPTPPPASRHGSPVEPGDGSSSASPALRQALCDPLLAFDTATERAFMALAVGPRVWQREVEGGARASALFLPALLGLLDEAGIAVRDLAAIAFGRGPGAFTGLRVACAVAQGLAFGAGKPVLPIDTLLAIAEDARAGADAFDVWCVMDARMGEIYAAEYAFGDGLWQLRTPPLLTTVDALNARWHADPPAVVAGNAIAVFGARLECGPARRLAEAVPRATGLLTLGRAAWAAHGGRDAALALPLYLRDKVAQTTAERDARVAA